MAEVPPAIIESRAEYIIGSLIIITRWVVRIKVRKIRAWYWDDWFSVSLFIWHTSLFAMVEYLAVVGAPLGFTQEQREALTPQQRVDMTKGAKGMFASFLIYIQLIWSAKGVLIVLFMRLTRQTPLRTYMFIVLGISVCCWLAACIATFTHCLPIQRNWQILPDPGFECSAGYTQNIVIATGNVLVDALLIAVPLQTMRDIQMRPWRRVGITFLLSLGVFVMAMAIARCILSLDHGPGVAQSSVWVFREALVTIFAVNAPALTALFRRDTWRWHGSGTSGSGHTSKSGGFAQMDLPPTIGGSGGQTAGSKKGGEIYKMTEFETSSRESTSNLVGLERHSHILPPSLRDNNDNHAY